MLPVTMLEPVTASVAAYLFTHHRPHVCARRPRLVLRWVRRNREVLRDALVEEGAEAAVTALGNWHWSTAALYVALMVWVWVL